MNWKHIVCTVGVSLVFGCSGASEDSVEAVQRSEEALQAPTLQAGSVTPVANANTGSGGSPTINVCQRMSCYIGLCTSSTTFLPDGERCPPSECRVNDDCPQSGTVGLGGRPAQVLTP